LGEKALGSGGKSEDQPFSVKCHCTTMYIPSTALRMASSVAGPLMVRVLADALAYAESVSNSSSRRSILTLETNIAGSLGRKSIRVIPKYT
jgi:hypothetical protein